MKVIRRTKHLRQELGRARRRPRTIGFVPTMGALHDGHLALVRRSRRENDLTVVSVFVNPTQFGPREDFRSYPRTFKKDVLLAKKEKVDIIFHPSIKEIYPRGYLTDIEVREISDRLCGRSRPGHFRGVATVVGKLLNIVDPDILYLGQKDAQQCVVLRHMVRDLDFPVKVTTVPTVREPGGLAMSSRNQYLSAVQRREAVVLYQALRTARKRIVAGERTAAPVLREMRRYIRKNSSGIIDYLVCVDGQTLRPLRVLRGEVLLALAVYFGKARLIDNIALTVK